MSQIIWDPQALQTMIQQLRKASDQLEQCREDIRNTCREGTELFQKNTGTSRQILDAAHGAMRDAGLLAERTYALSDAVARVREMFQETETSVRRLAEGMDVPDPTRSAPGAVSNPAQFTQVYYTGTSESVAGITPQWLLDAADQAFS